MATATVHIFEDIGVLSSGHGTTQADVDAGTVKFGLSDAVDASASPISVPTTTGNAYSYAKSLSLNVTVAATTSTSLLNRTIKYDSAPTGLNYFWKAVNLGSYVQAAAAADTTNASANGTIRHLYILRAADRVEYVRINPSANTLGTGLTVTLYTVPA